LLYFCHDKSICNDIPITVSHNPLGRPIVKGYSTTHIWAANFQKRWLLFPIDIDPFSLHNVWKYAATHVRRCGVTEDEKILEVGGK
jgi:hypothetical protein